MRYRGLRAFAFSSPWRAAKVQDFVHQQLLTENNSELLKQLIYVYSDLVLPQYSWDIINQSLAKIKNKSFISNGKKYPYISSLDANLFRVRIALMDQYSQKVYLPKLLAHYTEETTLPAAVCLALNRFPLQQLNYTSKQKILTFLQHEATNLTYFFAKQSLLKYSCNTKSLIAALEKSIKRL